MTAVTPNVDTTIFPRINFLKNFNARALRRDFNGRIFLPWGRVSIDYAERYPVYEGSTELSAETLPVDLGPSVTTLPTSVIDLRSGSASIDLNPLN